MIKMKFLENLQNNTNPLGALFTLNCSINRLSRVSSYSTLHLKIYYNVRRWQYVYQYLTYRIEPFKMPISSHFFLYNKIVVVEYEESITTAMIKLLQALFKCHDKKILFKFFCALSDFKQTLTMHAKTKTTQT